MPKVSELERQLLGITGRERELAERLLGGFEQEFARAAELEQPQIDLLRAIISGDREQIARLLSLPLAEIARQYQVAREGIFRNVPPGAGREYALAQLEREYPAAVSQQVRQLWTQAFPELAGIGTQARQTSLALLGGGMRAQEAAASHLYDLLELAARRRGSTLGILGSLAQLIGSLVGLGAIGGRRG